MSSVEKDHILGVMSDTCACLLYYDRKEDESLPVGAIEEAIVTEEITIEEIVEVVARELNEAVARYVKP